VEDDQFYGNFEFKMISSTSRKEKCMCTECEEGRQEDHTIDKNSPSQRNHVTKLHISINSRQQEVKTHISYISHINYHCARKKLRSLIVNGLKIAILARKLSYNLRKES
jgi:hypothetical protein